MKKIFRLFLVIYCFSLSLFSEDFYSFESRFPLEESREQIERTLSKIDPDQFRMLDETLGFQYGWISRWLSPFHYTIYLTQLEKKPDMVIIRVEGNGGDALSLRMIFYQEKISKENFDHYQFVSISKKSHFYGQALNFVHPILGILYAGYQSPSLTKKQIWSRSIWYFVFDSFMIWAAGRNWFQSKWDSKKYGNHIIGAMLLVRMISGIQNMNLIRGHNRYVKLGYTFPIQLY